MRRPITNVFIDAWHKEAYAPKLVSKSVDYDLLKVILIGALPVLAVTIGAFIPDRDITFLKIGAITGTIGITAIAIFIKYLVFPKIQRFLYSSNKDEFAEDLALVREPDKDEVKGETYDFESSTTVSMGIGAAVLPAVIFEKAIEDAKVRAIEDLGIKCYVSYSKYSIDALQRMVQSLSDYKIQPSEVTPELIRYMVYIEQGKGIGEKGLQVLRLRIERLGARIDKLEAGINKLEVKRKSKPLTSREIERLRNYNRKFLALQAMLNKLKDIELPDRAHTDALQISL